MTPPILGIATPVAVLAWFALLGALAVATSSPRVRVLGSAEGWRSESPAVVELITNHWRLGDAAAAATLLDLAARRWVGIEEIGPELALVRLRRSAPDGPGLAPHERMVLDHVTRMATADGVVATGALAEGVRPLGTWLATFRSAVIADARAAGLSRPRWNKRQLTALSVTAVPAALLIVAWLLTVLPSTGEDDSFGAFAGGSVITFALFVGLVKKLDGERGTVAGATAAGCWLAVRNQLAAARFDEVPAAGITVRGRALAYAAALGLADRAVAGLPVSTPPDDNTAWSDFGGRWHVVRVRYRGPWPWGRRLWGVRPWPAVGAAMLLGLAGFVVTFVGGVLTTGLMHLGPDDGVLPLARLVALVLTGVPILRILADLAGPAVVRGQVVRLRRFSDGGSDDTPRHRYFVGIDDGRRATVRAYGIDEKDWNALTEGDLVDATVAARLGRTRSVTIISPSRHRTTA